MAAAVHRMASVGDTQHFECEVVGFPAPNITWYKVCLMENTQIVN